MNNLKISYDGRVTCWNTRLKSPKASKPQPRSLSPEMGLFSVLNPEGKRLFLDEVLGSSHELISDATPKMECRRRRGTRGITPRGRSLVRQSAQYLEDCHKLHKLSFLTCTLPPEALRFYTPQTWAEVVNRFVKSLRYHLGRRGLSRHVLAVTEVQMQRWEAVQGQPPVHLHCLFQGKGSKGAWRFRPSFFQAVWSRSCESVWGGGSDWSASTRVEQLRSSSVSYLGKYMSKGVDALKTISPELLPTAWYSISTELKEIVKNATFKLSGQAAHDLYEYLYSSDLMLWARSVMSEYDEQGTCYLIAWIGALRTRAIYWDIVNDCRQVMYATYASRSSGLL